MDHWECSVHRCSSMCNIQTMHWQHPASPTTQSVMIGDCTSYLISGKLELDISSMFVWHCFDQLNSRHCWSRKHHHPKKLLFLDVRTSVIIFRASHYKLRKQSRRSNLLAYSPLIQKMKEKDTHYWFRVKLNGRFRQNEAFDKIWVHELRDFSKRTTTHLECLCFYCCFTSYPRTYDVCCTLYTGSQ